MVNRDTRRFKKDILLADILPNPNFQYLASGPENGKITSLVVMLHGYGRNALYMQKMADEVRIRVPGAMVLCVHGPRAMNIDVMESTQEHHLHVPQEVVAGDIGNEPAMMREWFAIDGNRDDLILRLEEVCADLNAFIDVQRDMFSLSEKKIVLMGFSQGAGTALYAAYTRHSEIGGLVCHSSIVIEKIGGKDKNLRSAPQTLFLYGEKDPEFAQKTYHHSFEWVSNYTKGRAQEKVIPGLGHYTNSESRQVCSDYIASILE